MTTISSPRAAEKQSRRAAAPVPDRLRELACRVRRLGHGCSHNPVESFILDKLDVASALERLAEQAEGAR